MSNFGAEAERFYIFLRSEAERKNAWTSFLLILGGRWGHAWEFSFNFSDVTENAFITINLLDFPHLH